MLRFFNYLQPKPLQSHPHSPLFRGRKGNHVSEHLHTTRNPPPQSGCLGSTPSLLAINPIPLHSVGCVLGGIRRRDWEVDVPGPRRRVEGQHVRRSTRAFLTARASYPFRCPPTPAILMWFWCFWCLKTIPPPKQPFTRVMG